MNKIRYNIKNIYLVKNIWLFFIVFCNSTFYGNDGDLDKTFGINGIIKTNLPGNGIARSMKLQPDGKIVVVGTLSGDFILTRYDAQGNLDKTFNPQGLNGAIPGTIITDLGETDIATELTIQKDKKILVAGSSNARFALVRYLPDGTIDKTFNPQSEGKSQPGTNIVNLGSSSFVTSMATNIENKTVVAGYTGPLGKRNFALIRFDSQGTIDQKTFNPQGIESKKPGVVYVDFGGDDLASSILIQPDGKILISGTSSRSIALARLNQDGSSDSTFNPINTGKVITDLGGVDLATFIKLQSDGKILVACSSKTNFILVRYTAHGELDNTFNPQGLKPGVVITQVGGDSFVTDIGIQYDGKIILLGSTGTFGNRKFTLIRYTKDGKIDGTFNPSGIQPGIVHSDLGGDSLATSLGMQTDGNLMVAGYTGQLENRNFVLARYLSPKPIPKITSTATASIIIPSKPTQTPTTTPTTKPILKPVSTSSPRVTALKPAPTPKPITTAPKPATTVPASNTPNPAITPQTNSTQKPIIAPLTKPLELAQIKPAQTQAMAKPEMLGQTTVIVANGGSVITNSNQTPKNSNKLSKLVIAMQDKYCVSSNSL
ncbi:MAG TPA: hypothetical protein VJ201_09090 [Candidatus Babeliales bacterium]|nr:hypothetical protein [Candidatus Babeliales bacterium]